MALVLTSWSKDKTTSTEQWMATKCSSRLIRLQSGATLRNQGMLYALPPRSIRINRLLKGEWLTQEQKSLRKGLLQSFKDPKVTKSGLATMMTLEVGSHHLRTTIIATRSPKEFTSSKKKTHLVKYRPRGTRREQRSTHQMLGL
jgi:hypothetical protein